MPDPFPNWQMQDNFIFAYKFMYHFARFEGALKRAGYLSSVLDGTNAKPNWDRFASKIESELREVQCPATRSAIDYLRKHPPKKEVVRNKKVVWQDAGGTIADEFSACKLFESIRQVRNNLFHGSKFNRDWIDHDRSEKLINSSLVILEASLDWCDAVRQEYESG